MRSQKTVLFSFLLLTNVGCEIIIRGTILFLNRVYPNYNFVHYSKLRCRTIAQFWLILIILILYLWLDGNVISADSF